MVLFDSAWYCMTLYDSVWKQGNLSQLSHLCAEVPQIVEVNQAVFSFVYLTKESSVSKTDKRWHWLNWVVWFLSRKENWEGGDPFPAVVKINKQLG